jgi:hypothetical protein
VPDLQPFAIALSDIIGKPDAIAFADIVAKPDAFAVAEPDSHPVADRRRVQRGIDRQPRQRALQPDDYQPGARHGAARRQRTDQLQ